MPNSGLEVLFDGNNSLRLLSGLWVSVSIALTALGISLITGTLLGLLMRSRRRWVRAVTSAYLQAIRIMPPLVLLFVAFFWLSTSAGINLSGRGAAILVFTLWGTAEIGDLVRGAIGSLPRHQAESAAALGLSPRQAFIRVILPQALRRLLPPLVNLAARMIMTTSLVVLIGVVEVLKTGQQIIDANRFTHPDAALWVYGAILLLYFLACWPLSLLARRLERKWSFA